MKKLLVPSLLAAAAVGANAAAIHTGLLNYWTLDGNGNDTASSFVESTGTTSDTGTVNGTATVTGAGLFGQAATLDGVGGNNITVADPGAAGAFANDIDRTGADLTISAWFQVGGYNTAWQALIAHGESSDYRIARRASENGLGYAGGTGDIPGANVSPDVNDGAWHHVIATTQTGVATQLFIDGSLVATSPGAPSINENGQNLLCIGCNPDNGREWNGLIDDVAMWDRALTQADVTQIYNAGVAGVSLGNIPEPSVGILAGLAGLALMFRRRK